MHLWDYSGEKITDIQAHSDIIRQIIEVTDVGILTCSNDAVIKFFGFETLEEFSSFPTIHEKFIFAIASLGDLDFASGGEDNRIKTYIDGNEKDEILLPSTVWQIAVDQSMSKDILVACGDG